MSYRRKIVGRAFKTSEDLTMEYAKAHKHSDVVRFSGQFRISYGWRLECGHTIRGEQGAGKKSVDCDYCRYAAGGMGWCRPEDVAEFQGYAQANLTEWTPLNEPPAAP